MDILERVRGQKGQSSLWARTRLAVLGERGQNTVEYLLMLTVVVGVVLVSGVALKKFMPALFGNISDLIGNASRTLGQ